MSEEIFDFYFHINNKQLEILQDKINQYKNTIENKYDKIIINSLDKEKRLKYYNFAKNIYLYLEFMIHDNKNIEFNSFNVKVICNNIVEYLNSKKYNITYLDNSYLNLLFTDIYINMEDTSQRNKFINTLYNIFNYKFKKEYINIDDILKIYMERNN